MSSEDLPLVLGPEQPAVASKGPAADLRGNPLLQHRARGEHVLPLSLIRDKTPCFPALAPGSPYLPSQFQEAVLQHMQQVRETVGHSIGLCIMATAAGKTVLAALDVAAAISVRKPVAVADSVPRKMSLPDPCLLPLFRSLVGMGYSRHHVQRCLKELRTDDMNICIDWLATNGCDSGDETVDLLCAEMPPGVQPPPCAVLFLVNSRAILRSSFSKFLRHFQCLGYHGSKFYLVESKRPSSVDLSGKTFVFCLFQSFEKLPQSFLNAVTHLIVDEVHHLLAETYLAAFQTLIARPSLRYALGMTATLCHRSDPSGVRLQELFRHVVYADFPWSAAKMLGHFPAVEYLEALPTLVRGRDAPTYAQLLAPLLARSSSSVAEFLQSLDRSLVSMQFSAIDDVRRQLCPSVVVNVMMSYFRLREQTGLPQKKKTLIFVSTIEQAEEFNSLLHETKIPSVVVHSRLNQETLASRFRSFENGQAQILVNVHMLGEGVDIPGIDCIVMARLTESETVFVQQLGRGLRRGVSQTNKELTVLDLALNLRRRWRRLQSEISDTLLRDWICQFWHVGNFVGDVTDLENTTASSSEAGILIGSP